MSRSPPAADSAGAWILAARPRTLPAAVAPVLVGTGLAASHGALARGPALAAMAGALLIQVGTNFANDYFDFHKGADTDARVGPVRAVHAGLLGSRAVAAGSAGAFLGATACGVYLTAVAGWPVVVIGLASIAAGVLYTGGPVPIGYVGLGDPFVFVFFGLVAVGGTYYVQALTLAPDALLAGAAMGALITAILVVNNLRDMDTDAAAGKRTLAVLLGEVGTRAEFALLVAVAFAIPLVGVVEYGWPSTTLFALATAPLALGPVRAVMARRDPARLNRALGSTARLVALFGILFTLGLVA
ncbi:MAG: 1,4-dihydroxy-2-naphthoate polyprenyltransferase [Gemmatimonadota bacterium]